MYDEALEENEMDVDRAEEETDDLLRLEVFKAEEIIMGLEGASKPNGLRGCWQAAQGGLSQKCGKCVR